MTSLIAPKNSQKRISLEDRASIESFQKSAPVNVVGLAKELGINVFKDDLEAGISGILRKDSEIGGASGYVILVHRAHHPNRQRFTVAHELGHYFLHREQIYGELKDDEFYRALPGPLETEANKFAADLLMPYELIDSLAKEGIIGLEELSAELQVSRQALAIRLGLVYDQDWK